MSPVDPTTSKPAVIKPFIPIDTNPTNSILRLNKKDEFIGNPPASENGSESPEQAALRQLFNTPQLLQQKIKEFEDNRAAGMPANISPANISAEDFFIYFSITDNIQAANLFQRIITFTNGKGPPLTKEDHLQMEAWIKFPLRAERNIASLYVAALNGAPLSKEESSLLLEAIEKKTPGFEGTIGFIPKDENGRQKLVQYYENNLKKYAYLSDIEYYKLFKVNGNAEAALIFKRAIEARLRKGPPLTGKELVQYQAWSLFPNTNEKETAQNIIFEFLKNNINGDNYEKLKHIIPEGLRKIIDAKLEENDKKEVKVQLDINEQIKINAELSKACELVSESILSDELLKSYSKEFLTYAKYELENYKNNKELADLLRKKIASLEDGSIVKLTREENAKFEAWRLFHEDKGPALIYEKILLGKKITDDEFSLFHEAFRKRVITRMSELRTADGSTELNLLTQAKENYDGFLKEFYKNKDDFELTLKRLELEPNVVKRDLLIKEAKLSRETNSDFASYMLKEHPEYVKNKRAELIEKITKLQEKLNKELDSQLEQKRKAEQEGQSYVVDPKIIKQIRDEIETCNKELNKEIDRLEGKGLDEELFEILEKAFLHFKKSNLDEHEKEKFNVFLLRGKRLCSGFEKKDIFKISDSINELIESNKDLFHHSIYSLESELLSQLNKNYQNLKNKKLAANYDKDFNNNEIESLIRDINIKQKELESLDDKIDNVRKKSLFEIFISLGVRKGDARYLSLMASNEIKEEEVREVYARLALFNSLPAPARKEISGAETHISPELIAVQISKGILRDSSNKFILDKDFLEKAARLDRRKELENLNKRLKELLKLQESAINQLADQTRKGITPLDRWLPFMSPEAGLLDLNQTTYTVRLRTLSQQISEVKRKVGQILSDELKIRVAIEQYGVFKAIAEGKTEKADDLAIKMFSTYGLNLSNLAPEVWKYLGIDENSPVLKAINSSGRTPSNHTIGERQLVRTEGKSKLDVSQQVNQTDEGDPFTVKIDPKDSGVFKRLKIDERIKTLTLLEYLNSGYVKETNWQEQGVQEEYEKLNKFLKSAEVKSLVTDFLNAESFEEAKKSGTELILKLDEFKKNISNQGLIGEINKRIKAIREVIEISENYRSGSYYEKKFVRWTSLIPGLLQFRAVNFMLDAADDYQTVSELKETTSDSAARSTTKMVSLDLLTASAFELLNNPNSNRTNLEKRLEERTALDQIDNDKSVIYLMKTVAEINNIFPKIQQLLIAGMPVSEEQIKKLEKQVEELKKLPKSPENEEKINKLNAFIKKLEDASPTKYDELVNYIREEAIKLNRLVGGIDKEIIPKTRKIISELQKQIEKTTDRDLKKELRGRVEALEAAIKLVENTDLRTFLDKSKLKSDSWNEWFKTEGPVVAASIAISALAITTTILTCGGAAPLWACLLAATVGGTIGSESAREITYQVHNSGASTSGSLLWSDRSRIGEWYSKNIGPNGLDLSDTEKVRKALSGLRKDVAVPYIEEITINFVIMYVSCGLGEFAGSRLGAALSKIEIPPKAAEILNKRLLTFNREVAHMEATYGKEVTKNLLSKFSKQFKKDLYNLTEFHMQDKAIGATLEKIDKRLVVVSTFLNCLARATMRSKSVAIIRPQDKLRFLESELKKDGHEIIIDKDGRIIVRDCISGDSFEFIVDSKGEYDFNPIEPDTNTAKVKTVDQKTTKLPPPIPDKLNLPKLNPSQLPKDITDSPSFKRSNTEIFVDENNILPKDINGRLVLKYSPDGKTLISRQILLEPEIAKALSDPAHPRHAEAKKILNEEIAHRYKSLIDPLSPDGTVKMTLEEYSARRAYQELTDQATAEAKDKGIESAKTAKGKIAAEMGERIKEIEALKEKGENTKADLKIKEALDFAKKHGLKDADIDLFDSDYKTNTNPARKTITQSFNSSISLIEVIRQGINGVIRGKEKLTVGDVIKVAESQLSTLTVSELTEIINKFGPDSKVALEILSRMSQFGNARSLNTLIPQLQAYARDGYKTIIPDKCTSIADNLHYIFREKQVAFKEPGTNPFHKVNSDGRPVQDIFEIKKGVLIIDDVIMHRLLTEPKLAEHIRANDIKLVYPEGWSNGINIFSHAVDPKVCIEKVLTRAKEISTKESIPIDKAIERAVNESVIDALKKVGLDGRLEILRNKTIDPSKAPVEEVVKQLAPDSMTETSLKAILDQFPPKYHQVILEILAHNLNVFSPKKMAQIAKQQQAKIEQLAREKGIAPEDVYYFVPAGSKSYGLVTYQHITTNSISPRQVVTSVDQIPKGGKEKMLVVLDDVSGSGESLQNTYRDLRAKHHTIVDFQGEIVIAPTIATEGAQTLFKDIASGAKTFPLVPVGDSKLHFLPGEKTTSFRESEYFKSLSESEKILVEKVLQDKGYLDSDTLISFWYMAPNNNNAFGSKFLIDFLLNGKGARIHGDSKPFNFAGID